jgi:hypothetical protein
MTTLIRGAAILLLLGTAAAQKPVIQLRGTVTDQLTKQPVVGAQVVAIGDRSHQPEITDSRGYFRLTIQGVSRGDVVRIRVTKDGYIPYNEQLLASEEIPLNFNIKPQEGSRPVEKSRLDDEHSDFNPVSVTFTLGEVRQAQISAVDIGVDDRILGRLDIRKPQSDVRVKLTPGEYTMKARVYDAQRRQWITADQYKFSFKGPTAFTVYPSIAADLNRAFAVMDGRTLETSPYDKR